MESPACLCRRAPFNLLAIGLAVRVLSDLASFAASPQTYTHPISPGITNIANHHVYVLLSSASWKDSEAEAVALGGHLATVRDQTEEDWLLVHIVAKVRKDALTGLKQ